MLSPLREPLLRAEHMSSLSAIEKTSTRSENSPQEKLNAQGSQTFNDGDCVKFSGRWFKKITALISNELFTEKARPLRLEDNSDERYGRKILEIRSFGPAQDAYSHMLRADRTLNFFGLPVTGACKFDVKRYASGPLSDIAPYNRNFNVIYTFSRDKTWHAEVRDPQFTTDSERPPQIGPEEVAFIVDAMKTFFAWPFDRKSLI